MGLVPRWEGGAGRGQVPELVPGDHVGGQGLEPGAGKGDLAGDAAQLCVRKVRAVSRRGVDARSRGSGRERTKAGVGWRRRSGGGAQGVAQGMAETGRAPGSSKPWKPTTQRAAVSRVHTGGALWAEVQKK